MNKNFILTMAVSWSLALPAAAVPELTALTPAGHSMPDADAASGPRGLGGKTRVMTEGGICAVEDLYDGQCSGQFVAVYDESHETGVSFLTIDNIRRVPSWGETVTLMSQEGRELTIGGKTPVFLANHHTRLAERLGLFDPIMDPEGATLLERLDSRTESTSLYEIDVVRGPQYGRYLEHGPAMVVCNGFIVIAGATRIAVDD